ncbi:MAG: phytoene desaturase, partial [Acidobacteria bacterium]
QVFSFHPLLVGGNPFTSSSIYTLIHYLERNWGVFFVKGGTGALVTALVDLFKELGGEIRLDSPVERIHTSNGRVTGLTTADGWHGDFDAVASNADVVHTYDALLGENSSAQREAARLKSRRFSMSLFVVYFGVRRRHTQIAHHDILFGPRYKPHLDEIFNGPDVSDDFSLYLHAPTLTDPSVAPEGCEAFYVLSPVPHLGNAPVDWSEEGPRYRDKILAYLENRYLPNLQADIETVRIITPDHFQNTLNSHLGSAFSLEPILTQSAWFRVHNRDRKIGGLYFAGAGTHPGAGVPGVVNSAKATAGLMIGDLLGEGA